MSTASLGLAGRGRVRRRDRVERARKLCAKGLIVRRMTKPKRKNRYIPRPGVYLDRSRSWAASSYANSHRDIIYSHLKRPIFFRYNSPSADHTCVPLHDIDPPTLPRGCLWSTLSRVEPGLRVVGRRSMPEAASTVASTAADAAAGLHQRVRATCHVDPTLV